MTNFQSVLSIVSAQADNSTASASASTQSIDERFKVYASVLGLDTSHSPESITTTVIEAIGSLKNIIDRSVNSSSSFDELRLHHEAQREALAKLEHLHTLANQESVSFKTEEQLITERRILGRDPNLLAKLGYVGHVPPIPANLIRECNLTNGTLVFDYQPSLFTFAYNYNNALAEVPPNHRLYMAIDRQVESKLVNEIPHNSPQWKVVPNTIRDEMCFKSKNEALAAAPKGNSTLEPRDFALMLGYYAISYGQRIPSFHHKFTFTNRDNVIVGFNSSNLMIDFRSDCDSNRDNFIGLAD